ncbi:MAG: hypothetical protein ABL869_01055 [Candidatus Nitrotoga sp.]
MNEQAATPDRTFTVATDDSLSALIFNARDRILFIAPGITEPVAVALAARLTDPKISITVILDNDPEVYRLGFGTADGLATLKVHCDKTQLGLRCQPGIRIGVLVADDKTMIYSPVPQLIEAGSTSVTKPNALFFEGQTATTLSEAAGAAENTLPSDGEIGGNALTPQDVEVIKKSLDENPAEPFDLTQKARVFSSRLQYVEFTVEKYQLTRQTVPIPAYLMGLAGDMQNRWHNSLSVINMEATAVKFEFADDKGRVQEISVDQKFLDAERKRIEQKFLIPVLGFGSVMFKNHQNDFERASESFKHLLAWYFDKLKEQIGKSLKGFVASVVTQLCPSVKANIPEQYKRYSNPTEADIEEYLQRDIEEAITVKTLIQEPKIKKVFKDIAYQSVRSNEFQDRLHKALTKAKVPQRIIADVFRESGAALELGGKLHNE